MRSSEIEPHSLIDLAEAYMALGLEPEHGSLLEAEVARLTEIFARKRRKFDQAAIIKIAALRVGMGLAQTEEFTNE